MSCLFTPVTIGHLTLKTAWPCRPWPLPKQMGRDA